MVPISFLSFLLSLNLIKTGEVRMEFYKIWKCSQLWWYCIVRYCIFACSVFPLWFLHGILELLSQQQQHLVGRAFEVILRKNTFLWSQKIIMRPSLNGFLKMCPRNSVSIALQCSISCFFNWIFKVKPKFQILTLRTCDQCS